MANKAIVKRLQQSGNLEGLMEVLRYPPDAELREAAAQAMGKLLDFNAVENLIRSTQLDPDLAVQKASRQALDQILGNRAQGAIDLYPVDGSEKETWLRINPGYSLFSDEDDEEDFEDDEEYDEEYDEDNEVEKDTQDEDDEEGEEDQKGEENQGGEVYSREEDLVATAETGGWLGSDLSALATILRTEGSVSLRVRAARALAKIGKVDMKAVDALAATALWSDSPSVRAAATKSLVKLFGDKEADELLHTYRAANGSTDWGDDFYKDTVREDLDEAETGDEQENDDLEEIENGPALEPVRQELPSDQAVPPKPLPYAGHPPVVQDESSGKGVLVVLVVIVVLVLVVLAFYLGIFK
jgi:hypothetical protein